MDQTFVFIVNVLSETWQLFLDASLYILFGILVAGLLKMFLSPETAQGGRTGRGRESMERLIRVSIAGGARGPRARILPHLR